MTERYAVLCSFLSAGNPRRKEIYLYADSEDEAQRLAIEDCQRYEGVSVVKILGIRKVPD